MKKLGLALLSLIGNLQLAAQCANVIDHWEAVVLDSQTWKYNLPNAPISNWETSTFNDASWQSGIGSIGFSDNDDNTLIANTESTVYMRKSFNIVDTSLIKQAIFCMDFDDGFVAYLNGVEITRNSMDIGQTWNSFATAENEANLYQGAQPLYYTLTSVQKLLLQNGNNVLAIETHNVSASSSDLSSRPFLFLGISNNTFSYLPLTSWFQAPAAILQSKLSIMVINTLGQSIVDDPRIICDMGIIYNGVGNLNCIGDPFNNYNGKISIELRGSSSQGFPKQPYGFSTLDSSNNSQDVSLIDMPAESDWILLNPYTDKTFMRDVLTYDLGRALNWYASRAQFVNLIIDGDNKGVYVLLEKIKRDKDRVDIGKITPTANSGDSLTGGYIFKVDKVTGNSNNWWSSNQGVFLQNHYPKWNEITATQQNYLSNYINSVESAMWAFSFADPNVGYRKYTNVFSFADLFILNELSNNIDGYRLSTFIHKDRDSKCGRFTMGPLWDYNLSFGNGNYCNGYPTSGWQLYNGCGMDGSGYWVNQLLQDAWFKNVVSCRWNELRQTSLSNTTLIGRIDTYYNYLKEAAVIDSARWQTIGNYVWPNGWVANSWKGEIDSMKAWVVGRLAWIDANMFVPTQACNVNANMNLVIDEINFNSESSIDGGDWIELHNHGSTSIDLSNAMILDGDKYETYCVLPQGTLIAAGARLVIYSDAIKFSAAYPNVTNKYGPLCFKINDGGQRIVIRDKNYKLITDITFSDSWQCSTDGFGRTLQLTNLSADPNLSSSWFASCIGGSPGIVYTPCLENIIVSEINYNSSVTSDAGDWIELHNKSNAAVNLSNWTLRDQSNNNLYTFSLSYNLAPNKYVVLFGDLTKFNSIHLNVTNKIGPTALNFGNTGDVIRLFNASGKLVSSICYGTASPWPIAANAGGATLENGQYNGNHNQAAAWFAGCPNGSPGYAYNAGCVPLAVDNMNNAPSYLAVAPNPATNELFILGNTKWKCICVMDMLGNVILNNISTDVKSLSIENLAKGNYILQGFDGIKKFHVKFTKL